MDLSSRLTIGISSFERPESLLRLVGSIRRFYPDVPIIVADDSTPAVNAAIAQLLSPIMGLSLTGAGYDVGLSVKRNLLVQYCDTELFCLCDDDFVFTEKTDLSLLVDAIDAGCDLAAGSVAQTPAYHHRFDRRGSVLYETAVDLDAPTTPRWAGYPLVELLLNFFVARAAALAAVPWDPILKLHEHSDWFMRAAHLRKTLVPACVVDHQRHAPEGYGYHRRRNIVACRDYRLQKLRDRGLTHYVSDGTRVLALAPDPARHAAAVAASLVPIGVTAAQRNPVGPTLRRDAGGVLVPVAPTPPVPARIVGPLSTQVPRRRRAYLPTTQGLPMVRQFYGLRSGVAIASSTTPVPAALTTVLDGARVVVLGSAPGARLPAPDTYDVLVPVNGGIVHVPRAGVTAPLVAVINAGGLGLVDDAYQPSSWVAAYDATRVLTACVILPHCGWTDAHDPLTATWWERAAGDLDPLRAAGATIPAVPIGLTPAGRDRLLAALTDGRLLHAAQPTDQATWSWGVSGWSAGLIAAAVACAAGASTICFAGVSTQGGHVHTDVRREPTFRGHLAGDLAVLTAARAVDAARWSTTAPDWAAATGIRLVPGTSPLQAIPDILPTPASMVDA